MVYRHQKGDIYRKEYKIVETSKKKAEQMMNDMAEQGWQVVCMTYWNAWKLCLLITFSREKETAEEQ